MIVKVPRLDGSGYDEYTEAEFALALAEGRIVRTAEEITVEGEGGPYYYFNAVTDLSFDEGSTK